MKKSSVCALGCVPLIACAAFGGEHVAEATCGGNTIRLYLDPLSYEVSKDGVVVVPRTEIGIVADSGMERLENPKVATRSFTEEINTPIYKKAKIVAPCNSTTVDFGSFDIMLAAMKDGVAWRFAVKSKCAIFHERADVTIPSDARCSFNRIDKKLRLGCEETVPEFSDAKSLPAGRSFYLPFVYSTGGKIVAVTEADVYDYPAWYLDKSLKPGSGIGLSARFAKYPKTVRNDGDDELKRGRRIHVTGTEDYIAVSGGKKALPWRVFILADRPSELCEADIVYALSRPADKDADFGWVKPGKVAWDWWNDFDNKGEEAGCTTDGYKRFIDFAAKNGVEYVILDEGWSEKLDIWKYSPRVDVEAVIKYANERGVGIILWMAWAQAWGDEERVVSHFAGLGVKGFKVDFLDRGDADIATFLEKFAAACARHKMIVDYHGVYRPTGMQRRFPNIVNYEGIHGLEQMKWAPCDKDMCANDVGAFFLRGTAGPMDYTPGAMDNYPIGQYAGTCSNPGSVGTRAHQMALMALYEAPLNMLSDSPTKYEKNMECFSFMASVPTVWAETRGLGGNPESFAAVARKAYDGTWWAAGITDSSARDFEIDTSFLGEGEWYVEIFRDDAESDSAPSSYIHETYRVAAGEKIACRMAKGGGFIARFSK